MLKFPTVRHGNTSVAFQRVEGHCPFERHLAHCHRQSHQWSFFAPIHFIPISFPPMTETLRDYFFFLFITMYLLSFYFYWLRENFSYQIFWKCNTNHKMIVYWLVEGSLCLSVRRRVVCMGRDFSWAMEQGICQVEILLTEISRLFFMFHWICV